MATASGPPHGAAALTVADLIRDVLGADPDPASPPAWPPDMFAVAATVLKRTGAYLCEGIADENELQDVSSAWRRLLTPGSHLVPGQVGKRWSELISEADDIDTDSLLVRAQKPDAPCDRIVLNLRWLLMAADEACNGAGLFFLPQQEMPSGEDDIRFYLRCADDLFWKWWRPKEAPSSSLCEEVHPTRAVVLPKLHVSPAGLTLNNLSHNLALCDVGTDVAPIWRWIPSTHHLKEERTSINLLVVPHPRRVYPRSFAQAPEAPARLKGPYFSYTAPELTPEERERIVAAAEAVQHHHGRLDAIVLPEMACGSTDFDELCRDLGQWATADGSACDCAQQKSRLARDGLVVIAGVADRDETAVGTNKHAGTNQVAVSFQVAGLRVAPANQQAKHHRWRLDGGQVRQYGLGSQLDPRQAWWEDIEITQRKLYFWSITEWLTMSVMLCEDLARQEPVAEMVRAVGPNLVIALLADGPQRKDRWSARYATVLAEDPGCSVLTVTSLGMSLMSRPHGKPESRVIALWKDASESAVEIDLPPGAFALLLSLTREEDATVTTVDGRTAKDATRLKLSGIHPVTEAEVDALVKQRGQNEASKTPAPMLQPYQSSALAIALFSMIQRGRRSRGADLAGSGGWPPELAEFMDFLKDPGAPDFEVAPSWDAINQKDFQSFVAALYNSGNDPEMQEWARRAVDELTELVINRSKSADSDVTPA